jgi:hypothetical protein
MSSAEPLSEVLGAFAAEIEAETGVEAVML